MKAHFLYRLLLLLVTVTCVSCQTSQVKDSLVVSVKEQKLGVYVNGKLVKQYPISTSKYGLGDDAGSYRTPLGKMYVAKKIGDGYPAGAVFKSRQWTGEVLPPNAPGRDPIVTRIMWLKGLEPQNRNAYRRFIYIHGTPEERNLGKPVSYGCIRMASTDVLDLYSMVPEGATIKIQKEKLPR